MFDQAGGDTIPDTPTRRALRDAYPTTDSTTPIDLPDERSADRNTEMLASAAACKPKKHIVADPDAPDAPVCKAPKYRTADPDDPNAPVCKSPTYIVAPDPSTRRSTLPDWGRSFGDDLAHRVR